MANSSKARRPHLLLPLLSGAFFFNTSAIWGQVPATVTTSVNEADVASLLDADEPASSSDYRISRLSFHPKKGSTEWVQYEFPEATRIENVGVFWFDEAQAAASFRNERKEVLPRAWKLYLWQNDQWQVAQTKETT